jgi:hypothetical protein
VLYFNREIFIQHLEACHRQCMVWKKFYYRKLLKSFHKFLSFLRMHNQIIHNFKHVHVDYNPLKGMLVLILSLKLSTVPYAAMKNVWYVLPILVYYFVMVFNHNSYFSYKREFSLVFLLKHSLLWNHFYSWGTNFRGFRG